MLDILDRVCKSYKECLACTRERFGTSCKGEFISYLYTNDDRGIICQDHGVTNRRRFLIMGLEYRV